MENNKFLHPEISTASRDEINSIQFQNLKDTLKHCYKNNKFYKDRMDDAGLDPDKVKDLSDIEKLPFTSKEELRDNYPFGLFCDPLKRSCKGAFLFRYNRQSNSSRLYQAGS